jgi:ATP-binding cassette subfamily B multidrug efflux pump
VKLILHYISKHLGIFLLSMFFLTVEALADLLQPAFMAHIVDEGVKGSGSTVILHYGLIMIGIAAMGAFGAVMRNLFASRTSQAIAKEMRSDMYHQVQSLSLENIDQLKPGSIITRITNDVTQVTDFINGSMRIMVKAPITCVGAIFLILIQTPRQLPMILTILLITSLLIAANMKCGYPRFGRMQKKLDQLNNVCREFLLSIRVVKAFHAEELEMKKFTGASLELANAGISAMRVMAIFAPLINLTVNFGIIVLLWLSQNSDASQIGKLMASVNYMTQILFALSMVSNILNTAVRAMASSVRIEEILQARPSQDYTNSTLQPKLQGDIRFEDVSFTYHGAGNASLQHISFHAKAGETIGIIGPTGSGKTTLVNLLPRLYDPTSGKVLMDGIDVTKIDNKILRSAVAVVSQKALLFTGTILANLQWGKTQATTTEIEKATTIACADNFIKETTQGYNTMLGQGGVNLSGGQKQRLSLARALLRTPKILILDDCTSALDAETEAKVLYGLKQNIKDMTVLLISQRISTVMNTDHILCLENGSVQGFGTHQELLSSCPTYQGIYQSQIGGENNA